MKRKRFAYLLYNYAYLTIHCTWSAKSTGIIRLKRQAKKYLDQVKICVTTPDRIEHVNTIPERKSKKLETEFSIAICRPIWRQMAIENTVSCNFLSAFVDC